MLNKRKSLSLLSPWLLLIPALAPAALVLIIGLYQTVIASLGWLPLLGQKNWTIDGYVSLLGKSELIDSFFYTILFGSIAATSAVLLGSLLAWCFTETRHKTLKILGIITASFSVIMPYGVVAQSTQVFIGQSGLLARIAHKLSLISSPSDFPQLLKTPFSLGLFWPYIIKGSAFAALILLPYYMRIKKQQEDEARTLGAKGLTLWLKVYHASSSGPLAIVGGITFAYIFGGMEVPTWLGSLKPKLLPAHFYSLLQHPDLNLLRERMALVILMAITCLISTGLYTFVLYLTSKHINVIPKFKIRNRKSSSTFMHQMLIVIYISIVILPIIWLMVRGIFSPLYFPDVLPTTNGFSKFIDVFKEPLLFDALFNGIIVATMTGIYVSIASIPAGRCFSKYVKFKGKKLAIVLCAIPLIVPAIVTITGTIQSTIKLGLYGSHVAVVLCHVVMTLPYAVAIQTVYQQQVGKELESAARTLGAKPIQYMTHIHLPLTSVPILLSFTLGFLISFTETFSTQLVGAGNIITLGALMAPTLAYGDLTRGSGYMIIFIIINGLLFYGSNNVSKIWHQHME